MFVPLGDDNPLKVIPFQYVTVGLIVANFIVYGLDLASGNALTAGLAFVPAEMTPQRLLQAGYPATDSVAVVPRPLTLLTYMFLHGDFLHIAGNMLFLWVFGDNVEDALGHARFLAFYLICGVVAALFHAAMAPGSEYALIGASGAVAGVIAAYLMLHPRVGVWVLVLKFIPLRITAALALGVWIATQFVMVALPDMGPIAWWAHIGGLLAGAILVIFMRRRGVPLFDRA